MVSSTRGHQAVVVLLFICIIIMFCFLSYGGRSRPMHESITWHTCMLNNLFHRGNDFRTAYARLVEIRSLVPASVRILALTATVTKESYHNITTALQMKDHVIISESPEKRNIKYKVVQKMSVFALANILSRGIRERKLDFPKTVVFCRR